MNRTNIEMKPEAPMSDAKEFNPVNKVVGALTCAPGACGGGPGGACQGACRGCREYIYFPPKEV